MITPLAAVLTQCYAFGVSICQLKFVFCITQGRFNFAQAAPPFIHLLSRTLAVPCYRRPLVTLTSLPCPQRAHEQYAADDHALVGLMRCHLAHPCTTLPNPINTLVPPSVIPAIYPISSRVIRVSRQRSLVSPACAPNASPFTLELFALGQQGHQHPATGFRQPAFDDRLPSSAQRPASDNRSSATGIRRPATGVRQSATEVRHLS